MTGPNYKLPLIAWVFGLIAVGASWGAIWSSGWLALVLVIAAVLSVVLAGSAFSIWFRQMKAQEESNGAGTKSQ